MKGKRRGRTAVSAALACAALLALLLSPALPALADVQPGVGEVEEAEDLGPIWLFDENGELLKLVIKYNDVRGYRKGNEAIEMVIDGVEYPNGELDLDEVVAFRALQLGISQLWPEDIPNRENMAVAWTDPSPVMEGIMEYMTACVTRDTFDIDVPAGTSVENLTLENYRFAFVDIEEDEDDDDVGDEGNEAEFETQVLEEVFPEDFLGLRSNVLLFQADVEEENRYREQWEEVRELFLAEEADALFDVEDEGGSVPVWPLIFSLGLLCAVAGTTIYGAVRGKN
jgi:hypothetical protein